MSLSIGILGLASFYGPAYANRAADRADCSVVAAYADATDDSLSALSRPTRATFESEYGCPVYDDVEQVLNRSDAVVVATRTTRRSDDARRALQAGVSVLCAKPAAASYADAVAVAEAADAADVPVVFTTPARYDDAVQGLQKHLDSGAIGDVIAVRASIRHDRVPAAGIEANAEHASEEAGAAYAMAVYTADALLWLAADDPKRVTAEYNNANTPHSTHPDIGTGTVQFRDGSLGTMTMTYSTDCREAWGNWELEVVGTDGMLRTSHQGYEGFYWAAGDPEDRSTTAFGRTTSPVLDRNLDAFVRTNRTERPKATPRADHQAAALGLCSAWERAAEEGPIVFEEWPPLPE